MRYIQSMFELWCLLMICLTLGRRLLTSGPQSLQRLRLFLAPGVGLSALVLLSSIYGRLFPFQTIYTLLLILILMAVSWYYEPQKKALIRDSLTLCLFASIAAFPVMCSEIRYAGYSPFTDIYTYLVQSQWLQFHAFSEEAIPSAHFPALTQIALYQQSGSRMGGSYLLGFVQSLFHLTWSYDAYLATVSTALVIGCLFLGGIVRQVVPLKQTVVLGLALLPSVLFNGFLFGAEWGFYPQTLGLAFAAGLVALMPKIIERVFQQENVFHSSMLYLGLPWVLCAAAFMLAYNEPFPIFFGAIGLFVLFLAFFHRKKALCLCLMGLIVLVEMGLLMNVEAWRIVKNIYQTLTISQGQTSIGWPVLWSPWRFLSYSFGLSSYFDHQPLWVSIASTLMTGCVLIGITLILSCFIRHQSKRRWMIGLLICFDLVLLCFFIKFRYFSIGNAESAIGQTFLQFKIAKYSALFSIALLASALAIVWYSQRNWRKVLAGLYGLMLIFGLGCHYFVVSKVFNAPFRNAVQQKRDPFQMLLNVRDATKNIPKNEVIYLFFDQSQTKLKQFLTYIFWDRPILANYFDDGYILGRLPIEDRNRSMDEADWVISRRASDDHFRNHRERVLGCFKLQPKPFYGSVLVDMHGGYSFETDASGHMFNWVTHSIDYSWMLYGNIHAVKLGFRLMINGPQSEHFRIQLKTVEGRILASYSLHDVRHDVVFSSPWLALRHEKHIMLHIESDGVPLTLSRYDARQAAFMVANVTLQTALVSDNVKKTHKGVHS